MPQLALLSSWPALDGEVTLLNWRSSPEAHYQCEEEHLLLVAGQSSCIRVWSINQQPGAELCFPGDNDRCAREVRVSAHSSLVHLFFVQLWLFLLLLIIECFSLHPSDMSYVY
jgi:hypothetical protein